ncbi:MAG: DNA-protecting protein DprA [Desulfobacterales bacterium]|nr:DNA-protecting protein DprA [Desulfobacterales bacterium]
MISKLLPWFALKSVPGIGNNLFKRLIDRFKCPESVFKASEQSLYQVKGISEKLVSAIKNHKIPSWVEREIDTVIKKGYRVITLTDANYPKLLLEIPDPPSFLYVYGNIDSSIKNIAIVGSRSATNYGISATKRLCSELVDFGITIVSGLAKGIDTAAHIGTLSAKGKTIAVLGSGLLRVYPEENISLFHKIAENGAVISEFSLTESPNKYNFPLRNRIISGVSLGTVVVEAAQKSGSLITAKLALDQNREVFAVPGQVDSFKSFGTHNLIKQGAKLVVTAQDIIDEISNIIDVKSPVQKNRPLDISEEELHILDSIEIVPIHIDEIVRKTGIEVSKISSILLMLELKGIVKQLQGKFFSKEV